MRIPFGPGSIVALVVLIGVALLFVEEWRDPSHTQPGVSQPGDAAPDAAAQNLEAFKERSPALIAAYMGSSEPVKRLQLGAGSSRHAGWLNTDIEPGDGLAYLDATKPFPFEDGSLHYIYSEHVIEHLSYDEGKFMAAEAYRVLAPGGKMRISTPDLTQFLRLFDKQPSEEAKAYLVGKMRWHEWPDEPNQAAIILNLQMSSWGHKFMYDLQTLGAVLTRAGFQNVQSFEENVSNDEYLRNLEERDGGHNQQFSNYETMSVEVEKPRTQTTRD